jgi:xylan 1,4-beta-xylosidase
VITIGNPTGTRLAMPWRNAIAVGRAFELLREDLVAHLALLQRVIGFRSCRFHAIFDDDMQVAVRTADGAIAYRWRLVDQVYDRLLALGLKPFVELNPMPTALASSDKTVFAYRMNVSPPRVWGEWEALIETFARHLVDRYGLDEVRSWHFEVWNEPNLRGFWSGRFEDYVPLYEGAARALKRVDAGLLVGGPATARAEWLELLIDHCAQARVPLDFVSTHLYPQDEDVAWPGRKGSPHAPGAFFAATVERARARVDERCRAHGLAPLPIHWTEWNAMACGGGTPQDWAANPTNDTLHGAAFVARNCLALDRAADTLCWWAASDVFGECGLPVTPYAMGYGLLTIHGLPKPAFHGFALLRRLGGEVLTVELEDGGDAGVHGCAATRTGAVTDLLLWNQRLLEDPAPAPWSVRVALPALEPGEHLVLLARVGPGQGSAHETWLAMGAPQDLAPAMEDALRDHAAPRWMVERQAPCAGRLALDLRLAPGEVVYAQVRPLGQPALPRSQDPAAVARWNAAMAGGAP